LVLRMKFGLMDEICIVFVLWKRYGLCREDLAELNKSYRKRIIYLPMFRATEYHRNAAKFLHYKLYTDSRKNRDFRRYRTEQLLNSNLPHICQCRNPFIYYSPLCTVYIYISIIYKYTYIIISIGS
jgi:hypothetical protein